MSIIVNTTVISNFAQINELELLHHLFGEIYISTEVYEEIQIGLEEGYVFYQPVESLIYPRVQAGWIHLTSMANDVELSLFSEMPPRLHRGEASSLAIARVRGWTLLTDDSAARAQAARLVIKHSGSIGCLVLAVQNTACTLAQANEYLSAMIRQGFRSPYVDLSPLLER